MDIPNALVDERAMRQAAAFGLALVLLSNTMALFINGTGIGRERIYLPYALLLLAVALTWARRFGRLRWAEIGLGREHWGPSLAFGMLAGLGLAALLLLFLAFPFLLARPVRYREIQDLNLPGLLWRLGVELTLATVLTEEILFRGILQAFFKRSLKPTVALVATNTVFALWHLVPNALSLQQNTIALPLIPAGAAQVLGYLGSLIAVGIGGLILSVVRERTSHLAGSMVLHWVTVAAVTLALYSA